MIYLTELLEVFMTSLNASSKLLYENHAANYDNRMWWVNKVKVCSSKLAIEFETIKMAIY